MMNGGWAYNSVKYLSLKDEDVSLKPRTYLKKITRMGVCICNSNAGHRTDRFLARQPSLLGEFQTS